MAVRRHIVKSASIKIPRKNLLNKKAVLHSFKAPFAKLHFPKHLFSKIHFDNRLYMPVLVTLLLISVYLIGVLTTKVQYLEKGVVAGVASQQTIGGDGSTGAGTQAGGTTGVGGTVQASIAPAAGPVNVGVGHLPPQGDPNAKVKIIEFADLRCPFCDQFFKETEPQIIKDYVNTGKAVFYFRHYAFLGDASVVAANAAECANEQSKFWPMHDYLYQNQPDESDTSMYTVANLTTIAGNLGMDTTQFSSCLSAKKYQTNVDGDMTDGNTAGVNGTPATFINGVLISGAEPYATFKAEIDKDLAAN